MKVAAKIGFPWAGALPSLRVPRKGLDANSCVEEPTVKPVVKRDAQRNTVTYEAGVFRLSGEKGEGKKRRDWREGKKIFSYIFSYYYSIIILKLLLYYY